MVLLISGNDKISNFQFGCLYFLTTVGVSIITLPSILAKEAGNDAWILCILSGLINVIFIYFMTRVVKKYGDMGFVGTLRFLFGDIIGSILIIPCILFFIFVVSLELRLFGEITKLYLLNRTPIEYIIIPMLLLGAYLARSGIEQIARFYEVTIYLIGILYILCILIGLPHSNFSNLRPFFITPISAYLKGMFSAIFPYLGYEILLVVSPNIRKKEKIFKTTAITLLIIIALYTSFVILSIVRLGVEDTKFQLYPVMSVIKATDVPGAFIERVAGILMISWIFAAYTSVVSYIYFYSVTFADVLNQRRKNHAISLIIPVIYIISLQGQSILDVFKIINSISMYLGIYTIIILPLLMFIMSLIKKDKGKKESKVSH